MSDQAMKMWIESIIDYLDEVGFELFVDEKNDQYALTHAERFGNTKIWIKESSSGLTLQVYGNSEIFSSLNQVNSFNRYLNVAKITINEEGNIATYSVFIPSLTKANDWLQCTIDDFMSEVRDVHEKLN